MNCVVEHECNVAELYQYAFIPAVHFYRVIHNYLITARRVAKGGRAAQGRETHLARACFVCID